MVNPLTGFCTGSVNLKHWITPFSPGSDRQTDKQVVVPHQRIMVHSTRLCRGIVYPPGSAPACPCLPSTHQLPFQLPPRPLTSVIHALLGMWACGWKGR